MELIEPTLIMKPAKRNFKVENFLFSVKKNGKDACFIEIIHYFCTNKMQDDCNHTVFFL